MGSSIENEGLPLSFGVKNTKYMKLGTYRELYKSEIPLAYSDKMDIYVV